MDAWWRGHVHVTGRWAMPMGRRRDGWHTNARPSTAQELVLRRRMQLQLASVVILLGTHTFASCREPQLHGHWMHMAWELRGRGRPFTGVHPGSWPLRTELEVQLRNSSSCSTLNGASSLVINGKRTLVQLQPARVVHMVDVRLRLTGHGLAPTKCTLSSSSRKLVHVIEVETRRGTRRDCFGQFRIPAARAHGTQERWALALLLALAPAPDVDRGYYWQLTVFFFLAQKISRSPHHGRLEHRRYQCHQCRSPQSPIIMGPSQPRSGSLRMLGMIALIATLLLLACTHAHGLFCSCPSSYSGLGIGGSLQNQVPLCRAVILAMGAWPGATAPGSTSHKHQTTPDYHTNCQPRRPRVF